MYCLVILKRDLSIDLFLFHILPSEMMLCQSLNCLFHRIQSMRALVSMRNIYKWYRVSNQKKEKDTYTEDTKIYCSFHSMLFHPPSTNGCKKGPFFPFSYFTPNDIHIKSTLKSLILGTVEHWTPKTQLNAIVNYFRTSGFSGFILEIVFGSRQSPVNFLFAKSIKIRITPM